MKFFETVLKYSPTKQLCITFGRFIQPGSCTWYYKGEGYNGKTLFNWTWTS